MGNWFSDKKKEEPKQQQKKGGYKSEYQPKQQQQQPKFHSQKGELSEGEKQRIRLQNTRDQLKEKKLQIEVQIESQENEIRQYMAQNKKDRAKYALQRKMLNDKFLQNILDKEQVIVQAIINIDQMINDKQMLETLKQANQVMKDIQASMDVQKELEDFQESQQQHQQFNELFKQYGVNNNEEIDQEYNKYLNQEFQVKQTNQSFVPLQKQEQQQAQQPQQIQYKQEAPQDQRNQYIQCGLLNFIKENNYKMKISLNLDQSLLCQSLSFEDFRTQISKNLPNMVIKDISYIDDELDNVSILNDIDFSALIESQISEKDPQPLSLKIRAFDPQKFISALRAKKNQEHQQKLNKRLNQENQRLKDILQQNLLLQQYKVEEKKIQEELKKINKYLKVDFNKIIVAKLNSSIIQDLIRSNFSQFCKDIESKIIYKNINRSQFYNQNIEVGHKIASEFINIYQNRVSNIEQKFQKQEDYKKRYRLLIKQLRMVKARKNKLYLRLTNQFTNSTQRIQAIKVQIQK
ncbi:hypothetical protein pb186bvf_018724 [Paramecium bursaria]